MWFPAAGGQRVERPLHRRPETPALGERLCGRARGGIRGPEAGSRGVDVEVGDHLDHRRGDVEVVGGGEDAARDRGRHPLAGCRGGADAGEIAVRREQRGGGLLTDPGDTGQAVRRVAAQRRVIGVLRGQNAVLRHDGGIGDEFEVAHTASGVDDPHLAGVVDELEEVAITGDDVHRHRSVGRKGADDVIGLVVGTPDDRDAEQLESLADHRDLRLERVGDVFDVGAAGDDLGHTVGLVRRDEVDAPLRAPIVVPAGDHVGRLVGRRQLRDHVEQSAHGIDGRAVGGAHLVGHAVERAEVQRCGVQQHEAIGHAFILPPRSSAAGSRRGFEAGAVHERGVHFDDAHAVPTRRRIDEPGDLAP